MIKISSNYHLTALSRNAKLGPMPASTSGAQTCPDACPLKTNGCYAEHGPQAMHWRKVTAGERGSDWPGFVDNVRRSVYPGQLWRHNVSGDLVGTGDRIDASALVDLTRAKANASGFTVNLSADSLAIADALADTGQPVVTILPSDYADKREAVTPAGRRVVVCPAVTGQARSCHDCGLCHRKTRLVIVGFPAHGSAKRKANAVASA